MEGAESHGRTLLETEAKTATFNSEDTCPCQTGGESIPATMFLFGGAFQPPQRISGPGHESAAEQEAEQRASPTAGQTKMAMVVDATAAAFKRNAVEHLMNRNAKRELRIQLKLVLRVIDEGELEGHAKVQPAWARLTEHALAHDGKPRRLHPCDANFKEAAPTG